MFIFSQVSYAECGISGGSIRILSNDFPALHADVAAGEKYAGGGFTIKKIPNWLDSSQTILIKDKLSMAITKVWIEDDCIGCGLSSETCPEVFDLSDEVDTNTVKENVDFSKYEEKIKEAAKDCPVKAISYL